MSLKDAIAGMLGELTDNLAGPLPARVESYDPITRRATVQPLVKRNFTNADGERAVERYPAITDVPVVLGGSGGARVKYPISVGDTVLVIPCSAAIGAWLAGDGQEVDPDDDRRFHLSDVVALTGLEATASDASELIEFTATGKVQIGSGLFIPTGPTGDQLMTARCLDPFTGQPHAILNPTNITTTLLAK